MNDRGRLPPLSPALCSVAVNVASGMLAEQLDCSVDDAFTVLQAKAGEDPQRLEGVAVRVLARHALLIGDHAERDFS